MSKSLPAPIYLIDHLVRAGRRTSAVRELRALCKKKVSRQHLGKVGFLAWRLKLARLGCSILNRIVRPSPRSHVLATSEERAAYAACLIGLGAHDEALDILEELEPSTLPIVLLIRVSSLVANWEYGEAIPLLLRYIESSELEPYDRLVGRSNLAAAFIHEMQLDRAADILPGILEETLKGKHFLLYGNALSLSAVNAILRNDNTEADRYLRMAEEGFGGASGLDSFFIRKWRVLWRLNREGATGDVLLRLKMLRREAVERRHWESVRDCDRFRCLATKDRSLFSHLYYGSPFGNFRRRLIEDFDGGENVPAVYEWRVVPGRSARVFDLSNGSGARVPLKVGDVSHRLLRALCEDFYRPFSTATLHSKIYPGENYNPQSSPVRVRQAIRRLRGWARTSRSSLVVEEDLGFYRLTASQPFVVRLALEKPVGSRRERWLRQLRDYFPKDAFSAQQAANVLGTSSRTSLRWLERGMQSGDVLREGAGALTRYRFSA